MAPQHVALLVVSSKEARQGCTSSYVVSCSVVVQPLIWIELVLRLNEGDEEVVQTNAGAIKMVALRSEQKVRTSPRHKSTGRALLARNASM
jgi:hypothetical protein